MTGAGSYAGNLPGHSTGSAARSTAPESEDDHPWVFLDSWLGAAARRNGGILCLDGMPQGQGRHGKEVEKG